MKTFLAALAILFVSSCSAQNKYDMKDMSPALQMKLATLKDKVQEEMEKWTDKDADLIPADFDEDTEAMLNIMDIADEYMMDEEEDEDDLISAEIESEEEEMEEEEEEMDGSSSESGERRRGRKGQRQRYHKAMKQDREDVKEGLRYVMKKIKQHGRMHKKFMFKSMNTTKRCIDMESRIDVLCSRVRMAKLNPMLEKVYMALGAGSKMAGWNSCCLEDEEARLECFQEKREERMDRLCDMKGNRSNFSYCCEASNRTECIADYKEGFCSSLDEESDESSGSTEVRGRPGHGRGRHHRGGEGKHHKRGGKNKYEFDEEQFEKCCADGNQSTAVAAFSGSPSQCLKDYITYIETEDNATTRSCVKGYLSCCISEEDNNRDEIKSVWRKAFSLLKRFQRVNKAESDEESSEEEGSSERSSERSSEGSAVSEKKEWRGGRRERGGKIVNGRKEERKNERKESRKNARKHARKNKEVKEEPMAPEEELFVEEEELIVPDETGQQIEEHMVMEDDVVTFEDPTKTRSPKHKKGRRMPDGMRYDEESGHYYYVDKAPPGWKSTPRKVIRRNRH